jgi:serine/threonine-protein phosphatase PGAM5
MTGELYIVRHAEATDADGDDPGFSERGRAQARALGARLARGPVAGVLHGPSRRTAETAAVLAEELSGIPLASSPLLGDRAVVPSPERRPEYPERYHAWLDAVPLDERDADGALLTAAFQQLGRQAREQIGDDALVLVTRAFVVAWFVREVLGGPAAQWLRLTPENAGLTVVGWRRDATAVLLSFNDTGHLT